MALATVALAMTAVVTVALTMAAGVSDAPAAVSTTSGSADASGPAPAPPPTAAAANPEVSAPPARLRITSIGVDAPLVELHLDSTGALQTPADFQLPGWYADGTVPGEAGPAVIAGHVDSRAGPAVFFRLSELRAGELVEVQRGGQWIVFEVVSTTRVPKNAFPTAQVYGPTPDRQLRLITCGGQFDAAARSYLDNVIVNAVAR